MVPVPSVDVDQEYSSESFRLTADDPLRGLSRWISDGIVDEAAAGRARQRWLEDQAAEDATISGVLLDLAERGRSVAVRVRSGRVAHGPVVAVGADFVAVREKRLGDVFILRNAIAMVRSAPGDGPTIGDRPVSLTVVLAEALSELAVDRPVVLVSVAGEEIRGELRVAGRDMVTVTIVGDRREEIHIALASIDSLVVLAR